jgi:protocatechuate 3,4-dioxygenase beta subunit
MLLAGLAAWFLARGESAAPAAPTPNATGAPAAAAADPGAPRLPASEPADARPVAVDDPAPTAGAASGPAAAGAAVAAAPALLGGRVTRAADGRPVAGVAVQATLLPDAPHGGPAPDARAVTDGEGAYRIELPGAGRLVRLEVAPGPDTTRTTLRPDRSVAEGEHVVLDVEVTRGVALAGTVLDADGRPVADAEVRAWTGALHALGALGARHDAAPDRVVRTDAAGAFEVVAVGPRFVLSASAPGAVPADRLHGEIPVGRRAPGLALHVSPARTLRARVLGAGDRPLARAALRAEVPRGDAGDRLTDIEGVYRAPPAAALAETDADGLAVLPGLPSATCAVEVRHDEHAPWTGEHALGDPDLLVRLDPGASLSGMVVDTAGAPLASARVQLASADLALDRNERRATTDEEGRFAFHGLLPDERALLSVVATGHAVRVMQSIPLAADTPRQVRVILGPGFAIEGRVVDTAGAPVPGATVAIEGERLIDFGGAAMSPSPTWEGMYHDLDRGSTDIDGRFRLGELYDGAFRVRVTHPDDPEIVARLDARSDGPPLHVVLDPDASVGVTLAGAVRDALTGRPVTRFSLTPMVPSGEGGLAGRSHVLRDEQGRFRVPGLEPGPMQVDVSAEGYAPWSQPLREYAVGLHVLDVALVPSRTVRLRFVDRERAPVTNGSVRFATVDGRELLVAAGPGLRTKLLRTDERGEVVASELPADRVAVGLQRGWLDSGDVFTLDLRVPPPPVIELVCEGPPRVELLVMVVAGAAQAQQAAVGGADGVLTLQARLEDGSLAPLDVPARVEVRDGSGALVAEGATQPEATSAEGAGFAPESAAVRLSVPREVLSLRVSAPGRATAELTWTPPAGAAVGDMLAVALAPDGS